MDTVNKALDLPMIFVGIVILVVMIGALFPTIEQAFSNITNINTSNPLINSIRPVFPFLTGLVLFMIILLPIMTSITSLKKKKSKW